MKSLAFHPLADLFPLIEGAAFDELVADVAANGLREPIVLHQGMILDGRNRWRACWAAGVEPVLAIFGLRIETPTIAMRAALDGRSIRPDERQWLPQALAGLPDDFPVAGVPGVDPLAFVISKNLQRRHLTDDQRSMIAARLVTAERGRPADNAANGGISRQAAATLLATGEASVERARTVVQRAIPEVASLVDRGEASVRSAAELATLPPDVQRRAIAAIAGSSETAPAFRAVVKEIRAEKQLEKKERRQSRERVLALQQRALPDRRYGVIYADPEWRFEPWSRETGMDRAADNHYPTSEENDIVLRPVGTIAAKDCALFLWATAPMLKAGLRVLEHWGFTYKSQVIWRKDQIGNGYWFRNRHEILLVGTRGDVPAPAMGDQWESVVDAPLGEHSAKPEIFAEMIEDYFPNLPKIELNARCARPGWDAWGLEAPGAAAC
ncbi:MAG TPA: MT-A70 family methyltransferase [Kaistia sp.]|nr:MT-A70 family methyltransferase [Kaistia sp.]